MHNGHGYTPSRSRNQRSPGHPGGGYDPNRNQPTVTTGDGWSPGVGGQKHIPKTKPVVTGGGKWTPGDGQTGGQQITPFIKRKGGRNINLGGINANWRNFIDPVYDPAYYGTRSIPFFSRFKEQVQPTNLKGYTTVYHGSKPGGAKPGTFNPSRMKPISTLDDTTRMILNLPKNIGKFVKDPSLTTAKEILPRSQGVYVGAEDLGYAKENLRRGVKFTGPNTGEVYRGRVPNRLLDWTTNMYGQKQAQIPSSVANQLRNIKEKGIKTITDSGAYKAIRSPVGKFVTKAMPWVGGAMGLADAGLRFNEGDYLGGALSVGSAIPGIGLGFLGGQLLTDKFGLTGGNRLNQAQGGIVNLYRQGGF